MTDINELTRKELEKVPSRHWDEDIGEFDSLIILPAEVSPYSLLFHKIKYLLAGRFSFLKKAEIWHVRGMHDSGYRLMDFIAVRDGEPIGRISGCSDVLHIDGIGGFGFDWLHRYPGVPHTVPPVGWSIDCLKGSGLLRLFCMHRNGLKAGRALSSFEIFSVEREEKEEKPRGEEREEEEIRMKPLSVFQWIRHKLGKPSVQYPEKCAICGTPTRGNRITGFRMDCTCGEQD